MKDYIIYSAAVHHGGAWDIGFGYGLVDAYVAVFAIPVPYSSLLSLTTN